MNKSVKRQPGKIVVLSGPSGSGKTTLHNSLLRDKTISKKLVKIVSATTRKCRGKEKTGQHYLFFTKKDFLHRVERGYFLEWQKVFSDYYGTPRAQVEKILKSGRNVLLCIDVKGAKVIFRNFKDALSIFIKAPSVAALKNRLQKRGTEDKRIISRRLAVAKKEMKEATHYCYVVVNDDLQKAVSKLKNIIKNELRIS
ncbi:MAG: guanylate kinase [Candidatus Omnitrophica bacterium]|nr:guanylate kinase [Candidatus Omnitrophota bacterium]